MCDWRVINDYPMQANCSDNSPEVLLARLFKADLGVEINPQALRMFVRTRWAKLSPLAHLIHLDD